jgi:hypothetical protein
VLRQPEKQNVNRGVGAVLPFDKMGSCHSCLKALDFGKTHIEQRLVQVANRHALRGHEKVGRAQFSRILFRE